MTKRPFHTLPAPQQAGMLAQNAQFRAFLAERFDYPEDADPAQFIRTACKVESRRELATDLGARQRFEQLRNEFDAWRGRIGKPE